MAEEDVIYELRKAGLAVSTLRTGAARRAALLPADRAAVAGAMDRVNPVYIPRNHRVEEALATAATGDLGPFHQLVDAVSRPFDERPGLAGYTGPAPAGAPYVTYCGT